MEVYITLSTLIERSNSIAYKKYLMPKNILTPDTFSAEDNKANYKIFLKNSIVAYSISTFKFWKGFLR